MTAMWVVLRGGGDLASGVALRLKHAGFHLLITELPQPLVVRRLASFAQAIYLGEFNLEGVLARRVEHISAAIETGLAGNVPVMIDPDCESPARLREALPAGTPIVLVDGRMMKQLPEQLQQTANFVIGLGPGYTAGVNCHVVIETQRGHWLGRAIWDGAAQPDTGIPEQVAEWGVERVLRAPAEGILQTYAQIGDHLQAGQRVAEVNGQPILANFRGVLRGLLYPGLRVWPGLKIGDIDPRDDARLCSLASDKAMAIGGGVLEAILSRPELRPHLWN
jgi:xanthine dehydrogenase accessory factor